MDYIELLYILKERKALSYIGVRFVVPPCDVLLYILKERKALSYIGLRFVVPPCEVQLNHAVI